MDLRIERTYRLLCDAFSEMLGEDSFDNLTVSRLCECAMVRRTTFYAHFSDKYDFFGFYVRHLRETASKDILAGTETLPFDAYCRQMTRAFVGVIEQHSKALNYARLGTMFDTLISIISKEISLELAPIIERELLSQGQNKQAASRNSQAFAAFYASGLLGLIRWWVESQGKVSKEELLESFDDIVPKLVPPFSSHDKVED